MEILTKLIILICLVIAFFNFYQTSAVNFDHVEEVKKYSGISSDLDMDLFLVSQDHGAACQDGSPPGYYYAKGYGDGADNFVIYFMGGGFCQGDTAQATMQDCFQRSFTILGTSTLFPQKIGFLGMLDPNATNNPEYYNWNRIMIMYCDGSLHQGSLKDPINYLGRNIYFRGENNTQTILQDILNRTNLKQADKVILSGGSAGGVAVYYWADYFAQTLKSFNPQVKFAGVPDSGLVLDFKNFKTGNYKLRNQIVNLMTYSNIQTLPGNKKCAYSISPLELYKCMFPQYLLEMNLIDTPLLVIQSEYDAWFVPNDGGETCIKNSNLDNCWLWHRTRVENYRQAQIDSIQKALANNTKLGVWMPACVGHVFNILPYYNDPQFEVPYQSGNTVRKTTVEWFEGLFNQSNSSYVFIDSVKWPNNEACSNRTKFI